MSQNAEFSEKYRKSPYPESLAFQEEGETIHDIDTVKHYTSEKIFRQPFYAMFLKKRKSTFFWKTLKVFVREVMSPMIPFMLSWKSVFTAQISRKIQKSILASKSPKRMSHFWAG